MLMLPLIVPASTLAAPAPIFPSSRLFFCSEIVTGKSQETRPLTEWREIFASRPGNAFSVTEPETVLSRAEPPLSRESMSPSIEPVTVRALSKAPSDANWIWPLVLDALRLRARLVETDPEIVLRL